MLHTNTFDEFVRHNHGEVCALVASICKKHEVTPVDDVIQDIYVHLHDRGIIEKFDPFSRGYKQARMSSYLYPIFQNIIRNKKKHNDRCLRIQRFPENNEEEDFTSQYNQLASDYRGVISEASISEEPDDLREDLDSFSRYLEKKNKKYFLRKRRDKTKDREGCSLFDVFEMLRCGWNVHEIAEFYGVSDTFSSNMKKQIREEMERYGIKGFFRD